MSNVDENLSMSANSGVTSLFGVNLCESAATSNSSLEIFDLDCDGESSVVEINAIPVVTLLESRANESGMIVGPCSVELTSAMPSLLSASMPGTEVDVPLSSPCCPPRSASPRIQSLRLHVHDSDLYETLNPRGYGSEVTTDEVALNGASTVPSSIIPRSDASSPPPPQAIVWCAANASKCNGNVHKGGLKAFELQSDASQQALYSLDRSVMFEPAQFMKGHADGQDNDCYFNSLRSHGINISRKVALGSLITRARSNRLTTREQKLLRTAALNDISEVMTVDVYAGKVGPWSEKLQQTWTTVKKLHADVESAGKIVVDSTAALRSLLCDVMSMLTVSDAEWDVIMSTASTETLIGKCKATLAASSSSLSAGNATSIQERVDAVQTAFSEFQAAGRDLASGKGLEVNDFVSYIELLRDKKEPMSVEMAELIAVRHKIHVILVMVRDGKAILRELPAPSNPRGERTISRAQGPKEGGALVVWLTSSDVHYEPLFPRTKSSTLSASTSKEATSSVPTSKDKQVNAAAGKTSVMRRSSRVAQSSSTTSATRTAPFEVVDLTVDSPQPISDAMCTPSESNHHGPASRTGDIVMSRELVEGKESAAHVSSTPQEVPSQSCSDMMCSYAGFSAMHEGNAWRRTLRSSWKTFIYENPRSSPQMLYMSARYGMSVFPFFTEVTLGIVPFHLREVVKVLADSWRDGIGLASSGRIDARFLRRCTQCESPFGHRAETIAERWAKSQEDGVQEAPKNVVYSLLPVSTSKTSLILPDESGAILPDHHIGVFSAPLHHFLLECPAFSDIRKEHFGSRPLGYQVACLVPRRFPSNKSQMMEIKQKVMAAFISLEKFIREVRRMRDATIVRRKAEVSPSGPQLISAA